jgi:predicted nucleic acid-binding protein
VAYLLDTTALSELTRPQPNGGFIKWLSVHAAEQTFVGAPSIGELEIGIALLARSKKRASLERWLEKLTAEFSERILSFDTKAARLWGRAVGQARRLGRTLPATDSQICAIAVVNSLAVVTRNVRHFEVDAFSDLSVINPWR